VGLQIHQTSALGRKMALHRMTTGTNGEVVVEMEDPGENRPQGEAMQAEVTVGEGRVEEEVDWEMSYQTFSVCDV
jgi:hypothetical protein